MAAPATRAAGAASVNWGAITSKLGLDKNTIAAVNALRKRNSDAKAAAQALAERRATVDFAHYKQVLKNQNVVSELEKTFNNFKPVDYDVAAQIKAIDSFQGKAVDSAKKAAAKIDSELTNLQATLKDIESARPFEDLTTADVAKARPQLTKTVEEMVKNGKWTTPGYVEKFGNLQAM